MVKVTAPSSNLRARLVSSTVFRVLVILALVIGTGVAVGTVMAYPLKQIDLTVRESIVLQHAVLAGSFDPAAALVTVEDLTPSWTLAASGSDDLFSKKICDSTASTLTPVSPPLSRSFANSVDSAFLFSGVVRFKTIEIAKERLGELDTNLTTCRSNQFVRTTTGADGKETREEFTILNNRPEPLVADYVSRTIRSTKGGGVEILVYFQVGDVLVAIDYLGPQGSNELFDKAEREILTRVAPLQFSSTVDVPGQLPLPDNQVTTTTNPADPSPTSSPPTQVPPPSTVVTRPTVPASTTTTTPKGKKKTSTPTTTVKGG